MKCNTEECSDGELAALTLAGRQDAFAEIMRRHQDPIFRLIRGYVGSQDEALDLVQECFTSAFKALDRFDRDRPIRAWLSRIAINKCRDWGRRRAVRRLLFPFSADQTPIEVADPSPSADETVADREELGILRAAIAALPRSLKEPLVLRTIEGLSQSETAAVLAITEKAVESRLYRARRRLEMLRTA